MADKNEENLIGAIAYLLGVFSVLLYIVKKDSKFVRFHSIQAILMNIVVWIAIVCLIFVNVIFGALTSFIGGAGMCITMPLTLIVGLGALALLVFMMYKAFTGEKYKLPVIGGLAEKYSG